MANKKRRLDEPDALLLTQRDSLAISRHEEETYYRTLRERLSQEVDLEAEKMRKRLTALCQSIEKTNQEMVQVCDRK